MISLTEFQVKGTEMTVLRSPTNQHPRSAQMPSMRVRQSAAVFSNMFRCRDLAMTFLASDLQTQRPKGGDPQCFNLKPWAVHAEHRFRHSDRPGMSSEVQLPLTLLIIMSPKVGINRDNYESVTHQGHAPFLPVCIFRNGGIIKKDHSRSLVDKLSM
jgi:hypothetical protein